MNNIPNLIPGPVYIALSGKKQTGKDTAAGIAVKILRTAGKRVAVTAFAEALKDIAIGVLGLPRSLVYGTDADKNTPTHIQWDTLPEYIRQRYSTDKNVIPGARWPRSGPMTVREVLQVLGTDVFREMLENNVWAQSPFRRDWSQYDVVIITDCRFPNEKEITEANGGTVIRIERLTGLNDTHPSETSLDNTVFVRRFENNGSIEDLTTFVRNTLKELNLI